MDKIKVGIIGCGNISDIYLSNLTTLFDIIEVEACADLILERAKVQAEKYGVKKYCTPEDIYNNPDIKIVVNLTIPKAHSEVSIKALESGKHVYVEKPITIELEDARKMLELAKEKNLYVASAPDTFLGAGLQTVMKLIEDNTIGKVVAATAFMACRGHETWHPDPEFYYKKGGGPMFDMGPYYITALVAALGPVKRVCGMTQISFPTRKITSEPKNGTIIDVDVPTHVSGLLEFESGAIATVVTSFDVCHANLPLIEFYGENGTIMAPDPNTFGGVVKFKVGGEEKEADYVNKYTENSRGLGVYDMARAIIEKRPNRANGEMAFHLLEIMHAIHISSNEGRHYNMTSTFKKPDLFITS